MIFNLLMYLLMADLQQVQSWIQQHATVYSWQSIGRVERPISARSQVQDRYLDTINVNTVITTNIASMWNDILDIESVDYIKWNIKWNISWWNLVVPVWWTYNIQTTVYVDSVWSFNTTKNIGMQILINWVSKYVSVNLIAGSVTTVNLQYIVNLNKWDTIWLKAYNNDLYSHIFLTIHFNIIKLS
jgi:hypothetical protein